MSLDEIRKAGTEALAQTLGPIGMVRFLQQFDTGKGDYTKEREQWLGEMSVGDILKGIEKE
jgi:hypothetical protein